MDGDGGIWCMCGLDRKKNILFGNISYTTQFVSGWFLISLEEFSMSSSRPIVFPCGFNIFQIVATNIWYLYQRVPYLYSILLLWYWSEVLRMRHASPPEVVHRGLPWYIFVLVHQLRIFYNYSYIRRTYCTLSIARGNFGKIKNVVFLKKGPCCWTRGRFGMYGYGK